jgi:radical SAM superfamily enzyme YgiQ (UPF0313 family)
MMAGKDNGILIIVARYIPFKEKSYYEFPLGLAYVSSCLKKAGHNVEVLNLNHHDGDQADLIKRRLTEGRYAYVLTGGLSAHYKQIKGIVADVRSADPDVTIIVGGGVVTSTPDLMFDYLRPDYAVVGEGEETIVELIDELENGGKGVDRVRGICYPDSSGSLVKTLARPAITDLDAIPWPDLDGFEFETYLDMQMPNDSLYLYIEDNPRFYPIISSRGCPYNCTFCYHPLGQKYRSRSVDDFAREVSHVAGRYGINSLAIFDELISADRKRLFEICDRLGSLPTRLHWMCQLRVDTVDPEMLARMKEAGCFIISYGFESASNTVLRSMKKHIDRKQIERALKLTREAGIGVQGYFIFGDTAETPETARETLDFWKEHNSYHITLGYVRPYPGSELWNREVERGGLDTFEKQLAFLGRCVTDPPNLSGMNEAEWFALKKDVQKALITNDHFGELVSSERLDGDRSAITIRCPHCAEVSTYKSFHQRILGIFKVTCRKCNQPMNMTPLAFDSVKEDYAVNLEAFHRIKDGVVPVTVTPCMHEAEFAAMAEVALSGVEIENFMDMSDQKVGQTYMGRTILKRSAENIASICGDNYFLIPLTRYANRIVAHLLSLGIERSRICRLDEILVGDYRAPKDHDCVDLERASDYSLLERRESAHAS